MEALMAKATSSITKTTTKLVTKVKAHSPEILVGIGIVGVVGGVVLACKGTIKAQEVIDEFESTKEDIQTAKSIAEDPDNIVVNGYSEEDAKQDTVIMYVNLAKGLFKAYGAAAGVLVSSLASILCGFGILKGRHAALITAYNCLDRTYSSYRERVKEAIGEDKERDLRYNMKDILSEETITDENGKKKKVKNKEKEFKDDPNGYSPYARFFDETSTEYDSNPDYNLTFLRAKQSQLNDLFHSRRDGDRPGYLFLNEVYRELGMREVFPIGQMVGWMEGLGDDFIDFGMYNGKRSKVRDFVNGLEPAILLDFNVDGVIYDKL